MAAKKNSTPSRPENAFCLEIPSIRLGEFDMGGVLYHAHYFHLFEQGREALLSRGGAPYRGIVESGMHLPLIEAHQAFKKPVVYGQGVELYLWLDELRRTTVTFCYELTMHSGAADFGASESGVLGELVHSAKTKHACIRRLPTGEFKPSRFPEEVHRIFLTVLKS